MFAPINKLSSLIGTGIIFLFLSAGLFAEEGKRAPLFKVRDLKGKMLTSEKLYQNGPCVVFFWHSCCGLNKDQLTALKEVYSAYKEKGLEIIGIALDGVSKTAKVKKAVKVYKMPWVSVVDRNNEMKGKFNPTFVPSVFVISKGGKMKAVYNGYETGDDKNQKELIESLFNKKKVE